MRIIFMATPDFAIPALQALLDSEHEVVAVYTRAPQPKGRGQRIIETPIHQLAKQHHITVYTPFSLKEVEAQRVFLSHQADIAVVVAYGLILPKAILEACPLGAINIHASLLPRWRGAAPIQRAIEAGDPKTGVTIMRMDEGLDTGDMLLKGELVIDSTTTAEMVHDGLSVLGGELLLQALAGLAKGTLQSTKQEDEKSTYASKLTKEEAHINWDNDAEVIERKIRAFNPYPGAYGIINGEKIKILSAVVEQGGENVQPAVVLDEQLRVACKKNILRLTQVQRQGKKPMNVDEFLRGFKVTKGLRVE